jgi:hypothetical protein
MNTAHPSETTDVSRRRALRAEATKCIVADLEHRIDFYGDRFDLVVILADALKKVLSPIYHREQRMLAGQIVGQGLGRWVRPSWYENAWRQEAEKAEDADGDE